MSTQPSPTPVSPADAITAFEAANSTLVGDMNVKQGTASALAKAQAADDVAGQAVIGDSAAVGAAIDMLIDSLSAYKSALPPVPPSPAPVQDPNPPA